LYQSSELVASARARWIAELAEALEAAGRVAILLGGEQAGSDELAALRDRISAARAELDALRSGGLGEVRRQIGPDWTKLAAWHGNLTERAKL